jgi:hypothetical protein
MRMSFVRTMCFWFALGGFTIGVMSAAFAQSGGIAYPQPMTMEREYCYRVICDYLEKTSIAEGCVPLSVVPSTGIAGGITYDWDHYRKADLDIPVENCVGGDLLAEAMIFGGSSLKGSSSSIAFSLKDSVNYSLNVDEQGCGCDGGLCDVAICNCVGDSYNVVKGKAPFRLSQASVVKLDHLSIEIQGSATTGLAYFIGDAKGFLEVFSDANGNGKIDPLENVVFSAATETVVVNNLQFYDADRAVQTIGQLPRGSYIAVYTFTHTFNANLLGDLAQNNFTFDDPSDTVVLNGSISVTPSRLPSNPQGTPISTSSGSVSSK